jgi:hypothetical protein
MTGVRVHGDAQDSKLNVPICSRLSMLVIMVKVILESIVQLVLYEEQWPGSRIMEYSQ